MLASSRTGHVFYSCFDFFLRLTKHSIKFNSFFMPLNTRGVTTMVAWL